MVRILSDLFSAHGLPERKGQGKLRNVFATLNELAQAPGFAQYLEIVFRYALQKGEKVGLQKGASRVLLHELTPEQQDALSEKILDAVSFEEIHAWLKSIRGS